MTRQRVDKVLVARGLAPSREKARALILSGDVIVNEQRIDKAGFLIGEKDAIRIRGGGSSYVSRGGEKLERALEAFRIDPAGKIALDVGASTGGFTHCLLEGHAAQVYALDVGYGQLAWSLRQDPRVVTLERTNIRHATAADFPVLFDLITIDVSFISLVHVLPVVKSLLKGTGQLVALIKPQFEVGKGQVGKQGVVRDPSQHRDVIEKIQHFAAKIGLDPLAVVESPIRGPKGNREFFIHCRVEAGTE
ncbi:MAG: TlyA family RNA methyltransferase [bacterium]|nr:TlyA family RNA methyltransferase [bacterium]